MLNSSSFPHSLLPIRTGPTALSLSASRKLLNKQKHPRRRASIIEGIFFVPAWKNIYQFHFEEVDIPITGITCHMRTDALACSLRIATTLLDVTPITLTAGVFNKAYIVTFHGLNVTVNAWVNEGLKKVLIVKPVPRDPTGLMPLWPCESNFRKVPDKQCAIHLNENSLQRSLYASSYY